MPECEIKHNKSQNCYRNALNTSHMASQLD